MEDFHIMSGNGRFFMKDFAQEDAFAGLTGQGRSTAAEAPKYADLI